MVVGVTNAAGGNVVPYTSGGTAAKDCRLRYALTLVQQGILDMYAFTECHMCKAGASRVRRYLREHNYSNVVAKMAYTSKTMASIEGDFHRRLP
jgi:hypothetical protein